MTDDMSVDEAIRFLQSIDGLNYMDDDPHDGTYFYNYFDYAISFSNYTKDFEVWFLHDGDDLFAGQGKTIEEALNNLIKTIQIQCNLRFSCNLVFKEEVNDGNKI